MNGTVVRRGNHFIRLEDEWCLIGGPWFDYLATLSNGGSTVVRLDYFEIPSVMWTELNDDFEMRPFKYVEWLPKVWHPGFRNPWRFRRWATAQELYLKDRWNNWMLGRRRIGYILLPDGKLPAFIDCKPPEDADSGWWYDVWEWNYFERRHDG